MIRPTVTPRKQRVLPENPMNSVPASGFCDSPRMPCLRFNPTAWAKLLFLRDAGETEVGGFGISAADDLLMVQDFQLVKQVCDMASVSFDDASVADFFDRQIDAGLKPCQAGRIWIHSHPGSCAVTQRGRRRHVRPSLRSRRLGNHVRACTRWGDFRAIAVQRRPQGQLTLPVEVDYRQPFKASDHAAWGEEYEANVEVFQWQPMAASVPTSVPEPWDDLRPFLRLV